MPADDEDRRYVVLHTSNSGCYSVASSGGMLDGRVVSQAEFVAWVRRMVRAGWTVLAEAPAAHAGHVVVLSRQPRRAATRSVELAEAAP